LGVGYFIRLAIMGFVLPREKGAVNGRLLGVGGEAVGGRLEI
jgi:hypothetical protein